MRKMIVFYICVSIIMLFFILYEIMSCYVQLKYNFDPVNLDRNPIENVYKVEKNIEIIRLYFGGIYIIFNILFSYIIFKKIKNKQ